MNGPVIAAFDGSENADKALHAAVDLAKTYGLELIVVNVQPNLNTRNARRFFSDEEIDRYEQETGLKVLEKTKDYLQSTGIKYQYAVITGDPVEAICQYADETQTKFIVMGARGTNPILTKILGSVSSGVVHKAKCPVLIIPA